MPIYHLSNSLSGAQLGAWEAESADAARDLAAQDAGCESHADMLATLGLTAAEDDIDVREYDEPSAMDAARMDGALRAEIDGGPVELYGVAVSRPGHVDGEIQIAWFPDHARAGMVYVGSGSSGVTVWTDADSPKDALMRYLNDDLRN